MFLKILSLRAVLTVTWTDRLVLVQRSARCQRGSSARYARCARRGLRLRTHRGRLTGVARSGLPGIAPGAQIRGEWVAGHGALSQAVAAGVCGIACRGRLTRPPHGSHPHACARPCDRRRRHVACSAAVQAVKALIAGHGPLAAVTTTPSASAQPARFLRLQSMPPLEQCRGGVHWGWQMTFAPLPLGVMRGILCEPSTRASLVWN